MHAAGNTPLPTPPERIRRSLEGELAALIASNAARMRWAIVAAAALIAIVVALHGLPLPALAWWLALTGAHLWRVRALRRIADASLQAGSEIERRIAAVFVAMAFVQVSLLLFFPFVPIGIGAVLTMYLVGMAAGMVPATGGIRLPVMVYAWITMAAIALAWSLAPTPQFGIVDRLVFLMICAMYAWVLQHNASIARRVFAESYSIRLEREGVNQRLREALGEAESANAAKTRFLAAASHDLRQPIHALSLFSGSLLHRPLDARTGAIAAQIDKSVRVLGAQLDALLDVSRLDAGVVRTTMATLDLHGLLQQLRDEYVPQARRKDLELSLSCPPGAWVETDSLLLRRILGNLLSNAVRHTQTGAIGVSAHQQGRRWCVAVRDTGPGIPESERERVFEEFYQLQNPERDRARGLGLGLAIVRRLCDLLKLELELYSVVGEGTEFRLWLPQADALAAELSQPAPQDDGKPHVRVLVVDDEEDVRLGMKTLLEEMGYEVQVAVSTQSAVDTANVFSPAMLLADFRLRGEDNGLKTIRALRERFPHLPAVLVTGDTAPDRLREAHAAGVPLLHKPVDAELLRDSITRALAA